MRGDTRAKSKKGPAPPHVENICVFGHWKSEVFLRDLELAVFLENQFKSTLKLYRQNLAPGMKLKYQHVKKYIAGKQCWWCGWMHLGQQGQRRGRGRALPFYLTYYQHPPIPVKGGEG